MDCCCDTLKKFKCESVLLGPATELDTSELHVQDANGLAHCSSQNIIGRHDCPLQGTVPSSLMQNELDCNTFISLKRQVF